MLEKEPNCAIHNISFANALLYSMATPMPGDGDNDDKNPDFDPSKDACNPDNFKDFTQDEEIIRV